MSADHKRLESSSATERVGATAPTRLDRASDLELADEAVRAPDSLDRSRARRSLAGRIELARLHARIDALERELAASECRRQAVVGQYELLLEGYDDGESGDPDRGLRSALPDPVERALVGLRRVAGFP